MFSISQLMSERTQNLCSFPYLANGGIDKWSPDFPRFLYTHLELQLTGTLNKSGSVGALGTANPLGTPNLIKNIEIAVDGKVIKKISGHALCATAGEVFRGSDCEKSTLVTAGNGNEAVSFSIPLDFQRPRTILPSGPLNPNDITGPELCSLRATDWNNISMRVDWNDHRSLVYGAHAYTTFAMSADTRLDVIGHINDDPRLNDKTLQGFLLHKFLPKRVAVPATSPLMETKLPAGARDSYSGILIFQGTDDGAGGLLPETAVIVGTGAIQIWVNSQSQKILDTTWARLRARNKAQFGMDMPVGYAYIDFLANHQYKSALRADRAAKVESVEILTDVVTKTNAFVEYNLQLLEPPAGQ